MSDPIQPKEANPVAEIEALLERDLAVAKEANQRALFTGVIACILIGGYLAWAAGQLSHLLDPEGLSYAATGAAVEAVPQASMAVRKAVVDGAPELAQTASRGLLETLPTYRVTLEEEMSPVIDEVAQVLANTAVDSMVANLDAKNPQLAQQLALQDGADAVAERLDIIFGEALRATPEEGEDSAQQKIDKAVAQLETIDSGLKRVVRGEGDPQERELLLGVMNLVVQYDEVANIAAAEAHRSGERPEGDAPVKKPAKAPAEAKEGAKAPAKEGAEAPAKEKKPAEGGH
ncbi:MAG: hypothetical protein H6741_28005 [Alphaproteobacteria bacterium]|nr:hypothetical protein [Alphaproteobacteria bacterium]MCB9796560.1 hypothetical protein [Alphaproteobacteria bacterium]